jgi:serine/threonine protein phosphatase PrpC
MEDQHTCAVDIPGLPGHAFFAVYDGHGGDKTAILAVCEETGVLPTIMRQDSFKAYAAAAPASRDPKQLAKAMLDGFVQVDAEMRPKLPIDEDKSGTTAVAVFLTPTHLICANAGDSRAVYCKGPVRLRFIALPAFALRLRLRLRCRSERSLWQVVALSDDHKPDNPDERRRIEAAGGHVAQGMMGAGPMRVDGDLAVSRCLGDFTYKQNRSVPDIEQKVTPLPELRIFPRDASADELVIVACDGIWDVVSNQEACDMLREWMMGGEKDCGLLAEETLDTCLDNGSKDNMSAIVVTFPAAKYGDGPGVAPRRAARDTRRAAEDAQEEQRGGGRR